MRKILPFCAFAILFCGKAESQAVSPYTNCSSTNIAIVRAGLNADYYNPSYLYNVNTTTGAMTLVPGGPFKDPSNPGKNLQVNGIGINNKDGFIYGLNVNTSFSTSQLLRLDKNYGVTMLGTIPAPAVPFPSVSFVNSAAGDFDGNGNFYFTAAVVNTSFQLTNLYLGKISNVAALTPSSGIAVTYYDISFAILCGDYLNSLRADPNNSGVKDITYNAATNSFWSYVTYKQNNSSNYFGQLTEIRPVIGTNPLRYEMDCKSVVNTHTAEASGMLIDANGNFLVSMTDGTVGKMGGTGPLEYNGTFLPLNNNTGLPNPSRGDMATCNSPSNSPLPVHLSGFNVSSKDCNNFFAWTTQNEAGYNRYELQQSTDNVNFTTVSNVPAHRSNASTSYKVTLPAAGKQQFYRLKIVDDQGHYSYSYILNVTNTCTSKFGFVINPNPVLGKMNLNWFGAAANTRVYISIFNANGSEVLRTSKVLPEGVSTQDMDVSNLPKGTYYVRALDLAHNNSYQSSFVKQ